MNALKNWTWIGTMVAVGLTTTASANLLTDPGFEGVDASAGDVSTVGSGGAWSGWNNWVPPNGAYYTAAVAHTGSQAGKTFSGPNAGIYQYVDVSGNDGAAFTGSLWFVNSSVDPLQAASQLADVRVVFFDGANGTGTALATIVAPAPFTNATTDVWTQLTVTGLVPTGAVSAQFMAFLDNPENAGGAMFVDDASFVVPEPASLALLAMGGLAMIARRRGTRSA